MYLLSFVCLWLATWSDVTAPPVEENISSPMASDQQNITALFTEKREEIKAAFELLSQFNLPLLCDVIQSDTLVQSMDTDDMFEYARQVLEQTNGISVEVRSYGSGEPDDNSDGTIPVVNTVLPMIDENSNLPNAHPVDGLDNAIQDKGVKSVLLMNLADSDRKKNDSNTIMEKASTSFADLVTSAVDLVTISPIEIEIVHHEWDGNVLVPAEALKLEIGVDKTSVRTTEISANITGASVSTRSDAHNATVTPTTQDAAASELTSSKSVTTVLENTIKFSTTSVTIKPSEKEIIRNNTSDANTANSSSQTTVEYTSQAKLDFSPSKTDVNDTYNDYNTTNATNGYIDVNGTSQNNSIQNVTTHDVTTKSLTLNSKDLSQTNVTSVKTNASKNTRENIDAQKKITDLEIDTSNKSLNYSSVENNVTMAKSQEYKNQISTISPTPNERTAYVPTSTVFSTIIVSDSVESKNIVDNIDWTTGYIEEQNKKNGTKTGITASESALRGYDDNNTATVGYNSTGGNLNDDVTSRGTLKSDNNVTSNGTLRSDNDVFSNGTSGSDNDVISNGTSGSDNDVISNGTSGTDNSVTDHQNSNKTTSNDNMKSNDKSNSTAPYIAHNVLDANNTEIVANNSQGGDIASKVIDLNGTSVMLDNKTSSTILSVFNTTDHITTAKTLINHTDISTVDGKSSDNLTTRVYRDLDAKISNNTVKNLVDAYDGGVTKEKQTIGDVIDAITRNTTESKVTIAIQYDNLTTSSVDDMSTTATNLKENITVSHQSINGSVISTTFENNGMTDTTNNITVADDSSYTGSSTPAYMLLNISESNVDTKQNGDLNMTDGKVYRNLLDNITTVKVKTRQEITVDYNATKHANGTRDDKEQNTDGNVTGFRASRDQANAKTNTTTSHNIDSNMSVVKTQNTTNFDPKKIDKTFNVNNTVKFNTDNANMTVISKEPFISINRNSTDKATTHNSTRILNDTTALNVTLAMVNVSEIFTVPVSRLSSYTTATRIIMHNETTKDALHIKYKGDDNSNKYQFLIGSNNKQDSKNNSVSQNQSNSITTMPPHITTTYFGTTSQETKKSTSIWEFIQGIYDRGKLNTRHTARKNETISVKNVKPSKRPVRNPYKTAYPLNHLFKSTTTKSSGFTTDLPSLKSLPADVMADSSNPMVYQSSFLCPSLFGFYQDPDDCVKFYLCSWAYGYRFKCPKGTLWNPMSTICDWPPNVHCGSRPNNNDDGDEEAPR